MKELGEGERYGYKAKARERGDERKGETIAIRKRDPERV